MKIEKKLQKRTINRRRFLHQIPELDLHLPQTKSYLEKVLETLPVHSIQEVANGLVVEIVGDRPGNTVLYRADMDANEVIEETKLPFQSTHHGRMHSCGHDGHMAIALGLIDYFSNNSFSGTLKVVFQPGEENKGGARFMVEDGVCNGVDYAFASHIWPSVPFGQFAVSEGTQMSAADAFRLEIIGVGGHSGMPELAHNPIDGIHQVVTLLNELRTPDVKLVVTQIHAGNPTNVIPVDGWMQFTLRSSDNDVRANKLNEINQRIKELMNELDYQYELIETRSYPATVNDPEVARELKTWESFVNVSVPSMASEDFSYFLNEVPGAFVWIGSEQGTTYSLHHPKFDFDESLLTIAIEQWIDLLHHFLSKEKSR